MRKRKGSHEEDMSVQKKPCRDEDYKYQLQKLKELMKKKKPKSKEIKEILDNTMDKRRQ